MRDDTVWRLGAAVVFAGAWAADHYSALFGASLAVLGGIIALYPTWCRHRAQQVQAP